MGFAQLKKTILEKAERDAKKIVKEAEDKAQARFDDIESEMEELAKKSEQETQNVIEMMKKRELASASLEAKKQLLITKKDILDDVFSRAKEDLTKKLSKADRKKLIEKLLKNVKKEMTIGKVFCNKMDSEIIKEGKTKSMDLLGGFIAEDKSGDIQIDSSFETILEDIKDKNISEISGTLFA